MTLEEALEWLWGERSMMNLIPLDPFETRLVRVAQADAAMTQQAYWIVLAHGRLNDVVVGNVAEEVDHA